MNKKEFAIKRISYDGVSHLNDYVAIEAAIDIISGDGRVLKTTYSPEYQEEMILGRKITEGQICHDVSEGSSLRTFKISELLNLSKSAIEMPEELFNATGCAHSCILAADNEIVCHMEDIKRHNALDKAIGYAVKNNIPLNNVIIFTSGRISFDYLEKVTRAGIGIVASRAAVTDAAIELAQKTDTTLLGFVRNGRANLYHEGKVKLIQEEK